MFKDIITTSIVSRNDLVVEIHPDIVLTKTGKVICIYRESDAHEPIKFAIIVCRVSLDGGHSWGERKVLAESRGEASLGKERKFDCLKCPRISELSDGRLVIIWDVMKDFGSPEVYRTAPNFLLWSEDDGETWSEPQPTSIRGIVPDKVIDTPEGALLTATNTADLGGVVAHRSEDGGKTWQGPLPIVSPKKFGLSEPGIVVMKDNTLVCYLRADKHYCGMKCFSRDDGRTWEGPYDTLMPRLLGRPAAGVLASGNVLVTYRSGVNYFGYLESQESALCPDYKKQTGKLLPILRNYRGPAGYTGWVQFPLGEILHVASIPRDAPRYYIEAHRFWERDI